MKRIAVFLLCMLLLFGAFFIPADVYAEEDETQTMTDGSFEFVLLSDGTAQITGYTGSRMFLTVPDTLKGYEVTALGRWAFTGNTSLRTVTLPDTLKTVKSNPFAGCTRLEVIRVPSSNPNLKVTGGILYNKKEKQLICCPAASKEEAAEVETGTRTIADYAFFGCSALTEVTLPKSLQEIGAAAFKQCEALTGISFAKGLKAIGDSAFSGCGSLISIALPEGLASLGTDAFRDCACLETVSLPASLKTLSGNPFAGCRSLSGIEADPENAVYHTADQVLFDTNTQTLVCYPAALEREEYTVPEGTAQIGGEAFFRCGKLVRLILPEGVKTVGDAAFSGCGTLQEVILPAGLREIGDYAFEFCSRLESAALPEGLTRIGNAAFSMCRSLKEAALPDGLRTLGDDAFSFCSSLRRVFIPDSLREIRTNPFLCCEKLTQISVSEGHPVFSASCGALVDTRKQTLVCYPAGLSRRFFQVPEDVDAVGSCAFYNCRKLLYVSMGSGVTQIGDSAFAFSDGLRRIELPGTVEEIGANAFLQCGACSFITEKGSFAASYCRSRSLPFIYERKIRQASALMPY